MDLDLKVVLNPNSWMERFYENFSKELGLSLIRGSILFELQCYSLTKAELILLSRFYFIIIKKNSRGN